MIINFTFIIIWIKITCYWTCSGWNNRPNQDSVQFDIVAILNLCYFIYLEIVNILQKGNQNIRKIISKNYYEIMNRFTLYF